jgi:hypothetical protein
MESITVSPMLDAIDRGESDIVVPEIPAIVHNSGQNSTEGIVARAKSGQFAQHPLSHFGMPYEIEKEQNED